MQAMKIIGILGMILLGLIFGILSGCGGDDDCNCEKDSVVTTTTALPDQPPGEISAPPPPGDIIDTDGNYLKYNNGVVYDTYYNIEWYAGPDNDTTYAAAKSWVESLTVAGGGWRLPYIKEVKSLYQYQKGTRNMTPLLETTGWWVWTGEDCITGSSWLFYFGPGYEKCVFRTDSNSDRVFAVRDRQ